MPIQVARHLRREITEGRLSGSMPGVHTLAAELGVHRATVDAALRALEKQGFLIPQGVGRRRLIRLPEDSRAKIRLRVGIMLYDPQDKDLPFMIDLRHRLLEAGHAPHFAKRTLSELSFDPERLAPVVKKSETDAWIVLAGSREVLSWFAERTIPVFAIFGGMLRLPVAGGGPAKALAFRQLTRRLLELGHQRIVLLSDSPASHEEPGLLAGAILDELAKAGIATGPYNVPGWDGSPDGVRQTLDRLFAATPPTALLIDGVLPFATAQQHLSRHGIHAPQDVSLICADPDPLFEWNQPTVAHVGWDIAPLIRRAIRWADNVAQGKPDKRKILPQAKFVDGGTVGPAPR
ncbi:GntR family transcriptional regulator [Haloferula helveola]|uniref:GntR family transcriptional regulator n=1 Tax=Haloferula helveola TaxID=490095 RepID=A0ABN6H4R4_9BACT|nr:GntR family transcriptional regulator [Haloferula helveola]